MMKECLLSVSCLLQQESCMKQVASGAGFFEQQAGTDSEENLC
jgi:hypothetical protein